MYKFFGTMIISTFVRNLLFETFTRALAQIKSQGLRIGRVVRFSAPNTRRKVEVRNEKIDDPVAPVPRTEIVTCSLRQRDPNAHASGGHPEPRGETHESPVALLKREGAFFDGRAHACTRTLKQCRSCDE